MVLAEVDGTNHAQPYEDNVRVRNIERDGRVAMLMDSSNQPYKSVHFSGEAEVADERYLSRLGWDGGKHVDR
ncbi:MAG: hypothetical protein H0V04_04570 [Chloroflexi bacterium]|nr:hypothetical protein [Chloroflexota bacterium]